MLSGPWPIALANLLVNEDKPGVYVLYRDVHEPAYVGRADRDLRSRITPSAAEHRGIRWFSFEYASSALDAYQKECRYYHELLPTDNQLHPDAPTFSNGRCPVCVANTFKIILGRGGIR